MWGLGTHEILLLLKPGALGLLPANLLPHFCFLAADMTTFLSQDLGFSGSLTSSCV